MNEVSHSRTGGYPDRGRNLASNKFSLRIFATCTIDAVGRVSAKRRSPDSVAIELSGYAYG